MPKLNGTANNASLVLTLLGILAGVAGLLHLFVRPIAEEVGDLDSHYASHVTSQDAHGIPGLAKRQDDIMANQEQLRARQEDILDAILELARTSRRAEGNP